MRLVMKQEIILTLMFIVVEIAKFLISQAVRVAKK